MDVRENYVMQKESRKEKSICPNCIHHNLCIAENNQPCFECNRFIDANGVTVQEWIPVEDRLPKIPDGCAENPEPVLYMMKNSKTIYAGYYGEGGIWRDKYFRQYSDSHEGVDANDVLCWMWQHDLPKPPKGE